MLTGAGPGMSVTGWTREECYEYLRTTDER